MSKKGEKICSKCNQKKYEREYYVASSDLISSDGRISICKDCFLSIVDFDDKSDVISIMRAIDRPFLIDVYQDVQHHDNKSKRHMGEYMRRIGMPQNRYFNYGDSKFTTDGKTQHENIESEMREDDIVISGEDMDFLVKFWGRGFSKEDYEFLQLEYERYLDAYEVDSRALEIIFQEASHQRLTIKKLRENGQSASKELKTLQDLLGTANVKPNQETGANATEQTTLSSLIKKFEDERPIPEPDSTWKDVDGIKKYLKVFFLGHLGKMLGLENKEEDIYEKEIAKHTVKPKEYD